MQNILLPALLMLSLTIGAAPDPSQITQTLHIGILDFPPNYSCKDDTITGTYVLLLKQVSTRAGFKHTLKCYPPKRLYTVLASGEVDFYMGLKTTEEYKNRVLYSKEAMRHIELRLYAASHKTLPITKEQWPGNRFVIQNGYNYGGLITHLETLEQQGEIILHRSAEHSNAVKMLHSGRADYFLGYKNAVETVTKEMGAPTLDSQEIYKLNLHFLVSKKTPAAAEVLQRLEAAYQSMEAQ
mgnify:CR=1 FL=1